MVPRETPVFPDILDLAPGPSAGVFFSPAPSFYRPCDRTIQKCVMAFLMPTGE
jgi:hypothetical protein